MSRVRPRPVRFTISLRKFDWRSIIHPRTPRFYSMFHVPFSPLAYPSRRYPIKDTPTFSTPTALRRHRRRLPTITTPRSSPHHAFLPFNIVSSRMGFTDGRKGCLNPGHFIRPRVFTGTMKFIVHPRLET